MTTHIYVLKLEQNKFYVGKTENLKKRYQQHLDGSGSAWTKKYKPISLDHVVPDTSPFEEDRYVKEYMSKYGMDNVRGGAYTSIDLTEEQEDMLRKELRSTTDKCLNCGKSGHFANQCKRKSSFKANCGCGKEFLDFEEFVAHHRMCLTRSQQKKEEEEWECEFCDRTFTTRFGCSVHEKSCKETIHKRKNHLDAGSMIGVRTVQQQQQKVKNSCYRCGRPGHYSPDCYARTHKDGYDLDSDDD